VANGQSGEILCVHEAPGAAHDFELFKRSGAHLSGDILLVADKGYLGLAELHPSSLTPVKKPRKGKLTREQKRWNRSISSFRIMIEHVNRRIKRLKIFQSRYRNKQRKHLMRLSLIGGIYNYELRF
jgi:Transposase DDE domain.